MRSIFKKTNWQERKAEVRQFLEAEGYWSVMNDTRWTAFAKFKQYLKYDLRLQVGMRVKFLGEQHSPISWGNFSVEIHETIGGYVEGGFPPVVFFEIEWIEINPIGAWCFQRDAWVQDLDLTQDIASLLKSHKIPFSREGEVFRIWGYVPRGESP